MDHRESDNLKEQLAAKLQEVQGMDEDDENKAGKQAEADDLWEQYKMKLIEEVGAVKIEPLEKEKVDAHVSGSKVSIQMERYKAEGNQDFEQFCNRFRQHVKVHKILREDLSDVFLLLLDDTTLAELENVELTVDERRDEELFTRRYINVLKPKLGEHLMRHSLKTMRKGELETASRFAYRIIATANAAYGEKNTSEKETACFEALLNGLNGTEMLLRLQEANVTSFNAAVAHAKRVEELGKMNSAGSAGKEEDVAIFATAIRREPIRGTEQKRENVERPREGNGQWEGRIDNHGSVGNSQWRTGGNSGENVQWERNGNPNQRGAENSQWRAGGNPGGYLGAGRRLVICYRCGGENHFSRECQATRHVNGSYLNNGGYQGGYQNRDTGRGQYKKSCHRCGRENHFARECQATRDVNGTWLNDRGVAQERNGEAGRGPNNR